MISEATKIRMSLMWRDDVSVNEIARRVGVTPNVVTGAASRDRTNFPARGTPLKPRGSGKPARGGRRIIPSLEQLLGEKK